MEGNNTHILGVPPRQLLRWMFLWTGLLLLFAPRYVVKSLPVSSWAHVLRPGDDKFEQLLPFIVEVLVLFPASQLCLVTSWGLKRGRRWSRWTGILASGMLLPGFPWLTLLGAFGYYALVIAPERFGPPTIKQRKDRWVIGDSLTQVFIIILLYAFASAGFSFCSRYAARQ